MYCYIFPLNKCRTFLAWLAWQVKWYSPIAPLLRASSSWNKEIRQNTYFWAKHTGRWQPRGHHVAPWEPGGLSEATPRGTKRRGIIFITRRQISPVPNWWLELMGVAELSCTTDHPPVSSRHIKWDRDAERFRSPTVRKLKLVYEDCDAHDNPQDPPCILDLRGGSGTMVLFLNDGSPTREKTHKPEH